MSEPISNHEIEDVLSSIRRLVSEDLRPAARAAVDQPSAPKAAATTESGDKLLLTPALRVVPDPVPQPEPVSAEPVTPVEDVVARLGASVPDDDWESPFGDPEVWQTPEEAVPAFVHRPRPQSQADDGFAQSPAGAEGAAFLDAPMATFAETDDILPDAKADAPAREPMRQVSPPQDDSGWADEAEAAVMADLANHTEEEVISGLFDAGHPGMLFDEEVLRDLVRDLIREELSGSLGERITRNVRKLVRAEIARALALREFE